MAIRAALLCVGKLKEKYWQDAVKEYEKRLSRYGKWEIVQVEDEKDPEDSALNEKVKNREGERLLAKIRETDFVVALCIEAEQWDSVHFSKKLMQWAEKGRVVFIIGGSLGLSEAVLQRANARLSFSKLTFPHQLMRVLFLEQAYRAMRIESGEPYHK